MTWPQNRTEMPSGRNCRSLIRPALLLLFALSMGAEAWADTAQDGLVSALKAKYPVTQTSPDRTQIAQAGIVMRVVKSGINARPWDSVVSFDNLIVDGAVQQRSRWIELSKSTEARLGQGKDLVILQPGDKVYISRIESKVEPKDDLLRISILSCDPLPMADGSSQKRYSANLSFKMPKDSLAESAPDQVEQMVEAMLAPDSAATSASPAEPQPATPGPQRTQPPQAAQPITASGLSAVAARLVPFGGAMTQLASASASPAAQAAPPPNITPGQTIEQVVAALGQPEQIIDLGAKKIYTYPKVKIVFVNGKVKDAE